MCGIWLSHGRSPLAMPGLSCYKFAKILLVGYFSLIQQSLTLIFIQLMYSRKLFTFTSPLEKTAVEAVCAVTGVIFLVLCILNPLQSQRLCYIS